ERWDLKGRLDDPLPGFIAATLRMSHNDYIHSEIEPIAGEEDDHDHGSTVFDVDSFHSRLELEHRPVAGWRGALGIQYEDESLTAEGEEAFVPSGETRSQALFVLEEKETGDFTWTLGARVERNRVRIDAYDADHDHDEHEEEHEDEADLPPRSFTAYSASAGALWRMSDQWQASLNYSRAQRAPSQTELFADGPHAATFTFERGDPGLTKETTNGFDLILHRHSRSFDFEISLFYNDISDFVFLDETGETLLGMPVRTTRQSDASFYGGEMRGVWQLHDTSAGDFDFHVGHDWVRASLDRGGALPRISPRRLSTGVDWHRGNARASLDYQHVSSQDRVADNETETAGYDMLDLGLGYHLQFGQSELELFARASNLLDEEARVHTSFLKNFAPLPGRNYTLGLRGRF
ncbi:MAG: TonB-dependent receptor, partial [Wenzhouxiangella sp.]